MIQIEDDQKQLVERALKLCHEKPTKGFLIVLPVRTEIEEVTATGIIIPNSAARREANTEGKHGKPQLDRMYDTNIGAVISVCDNPEKPVNVGDMIRFHPLHAMRMEYGQFDLVLITEIDYKTNLGNVLADRSLLRNPPPEKPADKGSAGKTKIEAPAKPRKKKK